MPESPRICEHLILQGQASVVLHSRVGSDQSSLFVQKDLLSHVIG